MDGDLNKRRIYDLSELFCAPQVRYSGYLLISKSQQHKVCGQVVEPD